MVDFLLEQEVMLERKHGIPYCPCQGLTKKREEIMKYFQYVGMLLSKVKTYNLETYTVKVERNSITMDVN